ncbi:hypothetical protein VVR85_08890 [Corynebacterium sp. LK2590]|uniref:hypothetical protein n=1 Tax=unclassified Corynebacterium TaxID=2624378 RepID=UPI0034CD68CF
MKRVFTLVLLSATALSAAACTSGEQTDNARETISAAAPSTTKAPTNESQTIEFGTPFETSSLPDNEAYLTITDATVGEECHYGTYGVPEQDDLASGKQYLQVWGEFDVQKLDNPMSANGAMLEGPEIIDDEGFTQEADFAVDCQMATDGAEDWFVIRHGGEKSRIYRAFVIPNNAKQVKLYGRTMDVAPATQES